MFFCLLLTTAFVVCLDLFCQKCFFVFFCFKIINCFCECESKNLFLNVNSTYITLAAVCCSGIFKVKSSFLKRHFTVVINSIYLKRKHWLLKFNMLLLFICSFFVISFAFFINFKKVFWSFELFWKDFDSISLSTVICYCVIDFNLNVCYVLCVFVFSFVFFFTENDFCCFWNLKIGRVWNVNLNFFVYGHISSFQPYFVF